MQMIRLIFAVLIGSTPAIAQDWTPMSGAEIDSALRGNRVAYADGWQDFHQTGRTLYMVGQESWGRWRVDGDRYCSLWPPSEHWDCYDMTISTDGNTVKFISPGGRVFEGTLMISTQ